MTSRLADVPRVEVKRALAELWALHHFNCRNNNQFVRQRRGGLHLAAPHRMNTLLEYLQPRGGFFFFQISQKSGFEIKFFSEMKYVYTLKIHGMP